MVARLWVLGVAGIVLCRGCGVLCGVCSAKVAWDGWRWDCSKVALASSGRRWCALASIGLRWAFRQANVGFRGANLVMDEVEMAL